MEMQKLKDWVDLLLKVASIGAIVVGGMWAYYQFRTTDAGEANIQIMVSTEVLPYSIDNRLLLIHAKPKNIGKVPVEPKSFILRVSDFPLNSKQGAIDLAKLKERYTTNILDRYMEGYLLEPGVEYDEVVAVVVPKNAVYSAYAEIDFSDAKGDEVDHTTIARVD